MRCFMLATINDGTLALRTVAGIAPQWRMAHSLRKSIAGLVACANCAFTQLEGQHVAGCHAREEAQRGGGNHASANHYKLTCNIMLRCVGSTVTLEGHMLDDSHAATPSQLGLEMKPQNARKDLANDFTCT